MSVEKDYHRKAQDGEAGFAATYEPKSSVVIGFDATNPDRIDIRHQANLAFHPNDNDFDMAYFILITNVLKKAANSFGDPKPNETEKEERQRKRDISNIKLFTEAAARSIPAAQVRKAMARLEGEPGKEDVAEKLEEFFLKAGAPGAAMIID